jgi:phage terminase large subunit-like protein
VVNGSGNGGGKTYGAVAIGGAIAWPDIAPKCLSGGILGDFPHPKRARIISTPKEVEEIGAIQTTIKELWPKGRYTFKRKGKSYPSEFITDTGWVIDIMTYEQSQTEFAGPNIGLLIFNEPPPEPIWMESLARTRKGGLVLMAATSLLENPWIVDGILGKANGDDVRVIYSDVEENCKEHGINGTLEHEQIEKILSQYDPDEREARKTGKPLSFSGRILKGFDRKVHVAEKDEIPEEGSAIYMVVDPAIGKPVAGIWAFITKDRVIHIYDEYPNFPFEGAKDSDIDVKGYVDIFKRKEIHGPVQKRIMDKYFGNQRRTLGGQTLRQEFSEFNIDFSNSYSLAGDLAEIETGIMKVKGLLKYDTTKPISNLNRPRIIISPKCKNVIASMERSSRNPTTGKQMEAYKDHFDCIRYLVMDNPEIDPPEPRQFGVATKPHFGVGNT